MAITKAAIKAKRKKMADLIRKGREDYPDVKHSTGTFLRFKNNEQGQFVVGEACAVGFAMLGAYDGKMIKDIVKANFSDLGPDEWWLYTDYDEGEWTEKIIEKFTYSEHDPMWGINERILTEDVISLNDSKRKSLDEIIAWLESDPDANGSSTINS
jgi:hypothetical protein